MRFLKNKIRLAEEAFQRKQLKAQLSPSKISASVSPAISEPSTISSPIHTEGRAKRNCSSSYSEPILASTFTKPTKNVVINYGKAILSFASSDLAPEYINRYFSEERIHLPSFHQFLIETKPKISGYKNFEGVFIAEEKDSPIVVLYKKMLKMLGEVFIKYFSVNWIIHGKVAHKLVYLQHRHLILRRIIKV